MLAPELVDSVPTMIPARAPELHPANATAASATPPHRLMFLIALSFASRPNNATTSLPPRKNSTEKFRPNTPKTPSVH
jgi:hypothetical protein